MNILPREKQIEIIAALCEGVGQRAVSRLTNTDRKTIARLALAVGRGAAELHDRMMVGLHVQRIECDELWAYVGTAIANVKRDPNYYYVSEQGRSVWVKVQKHDGRDYLKTQNDRFLPDNLLSLPECR